jgi:hypothetical protein
MHDAQSTYHCFEFKYADSPGMTPSCRMALELLRLDQLTLVCPGDTAHELAPRVRVRGLNRLIQSGLVG